MEGKYSFSSPEWADISESPKDLIRQLLVVQPEKRITLEEALEHPFFQTVASIVYIVVVVVYSKSPVITKSVITSF